MNLLHFSIFVDLQHWLETIVPLLWGRFHQQEWEERQQEQVGWHLQRKQNKFQTCLGDFLVVVCLEDAAKSPCLLLCNKFSSFERASTIVA
jgi:hypothetical protein